MEASWINGALFQHDIRQIVHSRDVDVVITAYSGFMTGHPPFVLDPPMIFDYLDCSNERPGRDLPEKPYLERTDGVMCVSELALERAEAHGAGPVAHIPNGVDAKHIRQGNGRRVRQKHGLEGKRIVALIGPTRCEPPYYLDAVQSMPDDVVLMVVGNDESLRRKMDRRDSESLVYVGRVPYEQVPDYYAATDVGLYPVDGLLYDDGRSPLKVFEYTAAGKPVVSAPIREVKNLDFENIVFADPDAASFEEGIEEALRMGDVECTSVERYDWKQIADRVLSFVRQFVN
jgi:glycosyltransferase involved in cell wall biosynthesis